MAEISGFGPLLHLRAEASSHILVFRGARMRCAGNGLTLWFNPYSTSLAELPTDDREVTFAVHARSADFQDLLVQGHLIFRITQPALTAARIDFAIDPRKGTYLRQPLEKLGSLFTELAQESAMLFVQERSLREVIIRGHDGVRAAIEADLAGTSLLNDLGLSLVLVRVAAIKPSSETERALEAPMRERVQEEADEAAFRRRAQAVDKERAIQENELANRIELARREQQLIEQRGQNARREATEKAEAERIAVEASAQQARVRAEADAEGIRAVEGARLRIEQERLAALRDMPPAVLAATAAQELAGKLKKIEHLNITPELLAPLIGGLVEAGTRRLQGKEAK